MTKPISRKMAVDCLLDRFLSVGAVIECSVCKVVFQSGDNIQFDHIHSDAMGGEHSYKNLRPVHYDPCHKQKSAKDVAALAKVKRIISGGRKKRGPKLPSKPFPKTKRKLPTRKFHV
jgi:5-methylcytosine-specific restriction endonuclease McrA